MNFLFSRAIKRAKDIFVTGIAFVVSLGGRACTAVRFFGMKILN